MTRDNLIARINATEIFDVLVIGGGASGLGVALDAISRGLSVLLVEQADFAKGTSSKATKLLHGGVRYLQKGDVGLVFEALKEREFVLKQAPHLSNIQNFIIPYYSRFRGYYYYAGLLAYDMLSAFKSLGNTLSLNRQETLNLLPTIKKKGLLGGIMYTDGQFDDARLCIDLVSTINSSGGICINYMELDSFSFDENEMIDGGDIINKLDNSKTSIRAKAIVNATGVFAEKTIDKDRGKTAIKVVPSRGSHIVLDKSFLQSDEAILIPRTSDDRILFLVPWHNVVLVGTTDEKTNDITLEPNATDEEIDFILTNASEYLDKKPSRKDILSTYAGLRPLVAPNNEEQDSKEISRSHKIIRSESGLVSLLGGKWTTFRKMGEDTIDEILKNVEFNCSESTSENIKIIDPKPPRNEPVIHEKLPYTLSQIKQYIESELVEKLEDLLCRRTRCIILHKEATLSIVDQCIDLIADIKGKDQRWKEREKKDFLKVAANY